MKNHIYSNSELQNMYENQNGLNSIEQKILNLAMWDRARRANYHGYAKSWCNIELKDNIISVYGLENGVTINAI